MRKPAAWLRLARVGAMTSGRHRAVLLLLLLAAAATTGKKSAYQSQVAARISGWYEGRLAELSHPPGQLELLRAPAPARAASSRSFTIIVAPPRAGFGHNLVSALLSLDVADALNASVYLADGYWHTPHGRHRTLHNSTLWAWDMFPTLRRPPGTPTLELPSAAPQTVDDLLLRAIQADQGHGEPTSFAPSSSASSASRAVLVATGAAYGCGPPCPQRRQHPLKCEGWCFGWMPGAVARGAALLYAREHATVAANPWRLPLHALVATTTSGAVAQRRLVVVAWHLR